VTDAPIDWEQEEERLASRALAAGDATGWFDELYQAGASGMVQLPWSRLNPHPLLVDWARARRLTGHGRRAAVVGCGLGADAEYLAALDFDTTGFDISATAIGLAAQRFPGTTVHYEAADLLQLPRRWLSAFDLVVEIITVQALPYRMHAQAIANISSLVAPAGTLLVIAAVHDPHQPASPTGPCPLRREELDAFADSDLDIACLELVPAAEPSQQRWRAEFHRPRKPYCP
jgi:SAM-dependent methyltransferase